MQKYFLKFPACPDCGSPLYGDSDVSSHNGMFFCRNEHLFHIFKKELPWEIKLNSIEIAYMRWISSGINGIHLINWPYSNMRTIFLGILADYTARKWNANVIVAGQRNPDETNEVLTPDIFEISHRLFTVDSSTGKPGHDIGKRDVFPVIKRAVAFNIKGTIHGDLPSRAYLKDVASFYGIERNSIKSWKLRYGASFGRFDMYNKEDYINFYSGQPSHLSDNVIPVELKNPELFNNYIDEEKPSLILIDGEATSQITDFLQYVRDIPTVILSEYNKNTVNYILKRNPEVNFHPLKSAQFLNAYCEFENRKDNELPVNKYITYHSEKIKINGIDHNDTIYKYFDILETKAVLTLYNIDYIIQNNQYLSNMIDGENHEVLSNIMLESFGSKFDINPWRDEFIDIIKNMNIDNSSWAVISRNRKLKDYLEEAGIIKIKVVDPGDLEMLNSQRITGIIIPGISGNLDFQMLNANKIIICGSDMTNKYARKYIRNKLYQEFYNPYIKYDGDMPEFIKSIMGRITDEDSVTDDIEISDTTPDNYRPPVDRSQIKRHIIKRGEDAVYLYSDNGRFVILPDGIEIYVISGNNIEPMRIKKNNLKNINGKSIIFDRSGFYRSIRAELLDFILYSGNVQSLLINREKENIGKVFSISRLWIDGLTELASKEDNTQIAMDLAGLNLSAKNPEYIKMWWQPMEISDSGIKLYIADGPKTLDDMKKIFHYLNDRLRNDAYNETAAIRCYSYIRLLQKVKLNIIRGHYSNVANIFLQSVLRTGGETEMFHIYSAKIKKLNSDEENAYIVQQGDGESVNEK